jgi:hypothetical protein
MNVIFLIVLLLNKLKNGMGFEQATHASSTHSRHNVPRVCPEGLFEFLVLHT